MPKSKPLTEKKLVLRPCPFCGSHAVMEKQKGQNRVACARVFCVANYGEQGLSEAQATTAWNNRAPRTLLRNKAREAIEYTIEKARKELEVLHWRILPYMKLGESEGANAQIKVLHEMQAESRALDKALRALNQLYEAQYVPSFEKDEEIFS